ncbi:MAG: hypothetical protein R3B93_07585 [Bacteroidia bacterium]
MKRFYEFIHRAKAQGVKVTEVTDFMQYPTAVLEYNGNYELIAGHTPSSWVNVRSRYYSQNKQLTKSAYEILGIPYPKSIAFQNPAEQNLLDFFVPGQLYVCKPLTGKQGQGVKMNVNSMEMIQDYWQTHKDTYDLFMLEEQKQGKDVRLLVIEGKVVAACSRIPAYVVGNGKDDLQTLIEKRQKVLSELHDDVFLIIDEDSKYHIASQNLSLGSIPEKGRQVQLKSIANISTGGIAVDITDELHPAYQEWVTGICTFLKQGYFGIDIISTDFTKNPYQNAWIIELNARPKWGIHIGSERKQYDVIRIMLEALFGKDLFPGESK